MDFYILNTGKERWEITKETLGSGLLIRGEVLEQLKQGMFTRFNDKYMICTNKEVLLRVANEMLNDKYRVHQELMRKYGNMKVKVTRK